MVMTNTAVDFPLTDEMIDQGQMNYREEDIPQVRFSGKSAGRVAPHSVEAEQSVLGSILIDNEAANTVVELLNDKDFFSGNHQAIFSSMVSLFERSEPIDILTLSQELKRGDLLRKAGGSEYITRIFDSVPTSANVEYYARLVKEYSLRRKVIHEASAIVEEALSGEGNVDSFLDSVEQRIFAVSESRTHQGFYKVRDIVKDSIKEVEKRYVSQELITGVASGFADLDSITAGLQPSDLIIIAGRPAMGKTSLALSVARHVSLDLGKAVAVFSLEMSREQIVTRMLCSEARVDSSRVRTGRLGDSDFPRLVEAASKLAQADLYIDDTPAISVMEMRAKARRLHREKKLELILVDYLQLMRGSNARSERREQEISEISRSLKALAKELHLPVVALSQLNRSVETRPDKRPVMADLRESGAIEQDADIIGFVYRDEVYHPDSADKGVAELIIGKHRNGPIGTIRLAFLGEYTVFENLAEEADYDYLGNDLDFGGEDDEL